MLEGISVVGSAMSLWLGRLPKKHDINCCQTGTQVYQVVQLLGLEEIGVIGSVISIISSAWNTNVT